MTSERIWYLTVGLVVSAHSTHVLCVNRCQSSGETTPPTSESQNTQHGYTTEIHRVAVLQRWNLHVVGQIHSASLLVPRWSNPVGPLKKKTTRGWLQSSVGRAGKSPGNQISTLEPPGWVEWILFVTWVPGSPKKLGVCLIITIFKNGIRIFCETGIWEGLRTVETRRAYSSIWFDGNQIKTLGLFGLDLFIQWFITIFPMKWHSPGNSPLI